MHVTLEGRLDAVERAQRYLGWIEAEAKECGVDRVLEDARRAGRESAAVLDERCRWALASTSLIQIAHVLPSEAAVLQTNMRAVAARSRMRGFEDLTEGHRWLCQRSRTLGGADTIQLRPATRRTV